MVVARPKLKLIEDNVIQETAQLFATFEADNWLEACEQYNAILGFGPYSPMRNEKGEPEHWYFTRIEEEEEEE